MPILYRAEPGTGSPYGDSSPWQMKMGVSRQAAAGVTGSAGSRYATCSRCVLAGMLG